MWWCVGLGDVDDVGSVFTYVTIWVCVCVCVWVVWVYGYVNDVGM